MATLLGDPFNLYTSNRSGKDTPMGIVGVAGEAGQPDRLVISHGTTNSTNTHKHIEYDVTSAAFVQVGADFNAEGMGPVHYSLRDRRVWISELDHSSTGKGPMRRGLPSEAPGYLRTSIAAMQDGHSRDVHVWEEVEGSGTWYAVVHSSGTNNRLYLSADNGLTWYGVASSVYDAVAAGDPTFFDFGGKLYLYAFAAGDNDAAIFRLDPNPSDLTLSTVTQVKKGRASILPSPLINAGTGANPVIFGGKIYYTGFKKIYRVDSPTGNATTVFGANDTADPYVQYLYATQTRIFAVCQRLDVTQIEVRVSTDGTTWTLVDTITGTNQIPRICWFKDKLYVVTGGSGSANTAGLYAIDYVITGETGNGLEAETGSRTAAATLAAPASVLAATGETTGGGATTGFFEDTFTGAAGTALGSHTPDVGTAWQVHPTVPSAAVVLNDANEVRSDLTGQGALYIADPAPASADHKARCTLRVKSTSAKHGSGPVVRCDPTAATFYHARYEQTIGAFQLYRFVNGAATKLDELITALADGDVLELEAEGTGASVTLRWYRNGGAIKAPYVDTSAQRITSVGRAGLRFFVSSSGGAVGNTQGLAIDNYQASLLTAAAVNGTASVVAPVAGMSAAAAAVVAADGTVQAGASTLTAQGGVEGEVLGVLSGTPAQFSAQAHAITGVAASLGAAPAVVLATLQRVTSDTECEVSLTAPVGMLAGVVQGEVPLSEVEGQAGLLPPAGRLTVFVTVPAVRTGPFGSGHTAATSRRYGAQAVTSTARRYHTTHQAE